MDNSESDPDSSTAGLDLFADPENYYPLTPPPTTQTYTLKSGEVLTLHLVGHSPLEAHHLWNGSRVIAEWCETQAPEAVRGRTVLELGAGAGLPSLVCAVLGARMVVVTDYPDPELVSCMWRNIDECGALIPKPQEQERPGSSGNGDDGRNIVADGFVWGADPGRLLAHLPQDSSSKGFDVLILADLLFRHSEHGNMLKTVAQTLRRGRDAQALVFFTSYRPWLQHKDLAFFDLAREKGFQVEKILERKMERPLFEDDPGDEEVRRTVTGWAVRWPEAAWEG